MLDEFDDVVSRSYKAADRRKGLRERAHHDINVAFDSKMLAGSAAIGSKHSDSVSFVDIDSSGIATRQANDFREISRVSLHRKDPVYHYQSSFIGLEASQHFFQVVHVVVTKPGRSRE